MIPNIQPLESFEEDQYAEQFWIEMVRAAVAGYCSTTWTAPDSMARNTSTSKVVAQRAREIADQLTQDYMRRRGGTGGQNENQEVPPPSDRSRKIARRKERPDPGQNDIPF